MTSSLVNSVSTEIRRLRIRLVPVSSRLDGLSGYVLVPTATRLRGYRSTHSQTLSRSTFHDFGPMIPSVKDSFSC